jgi:hypothetical protein
LNEDLLDIQKNYFDKDDKFWIAVDDDDRVVGSIGYSIESYVFYPKHGYAEYESGRMLKKLV